MSDAVLLDLVHGCGPGCRGACLREERACPSHVFLLCGTGYRLEDRLSAAFLSACRSVHALDSGSTAERLYRFKQTVDQLDLSRVRVLTTPRGRAVLRSYLEQLFTALYTFEYHVDELTCPGCAGSAHSDSPAEAGSAEEEVSGFLQQLPALKGGVRVLKSSLIPECFGHGFSTRSGGVSYIPTLSSLNLFSSSRRRDPRAVVQENRRRLALHAGFHPQPLCLVKVDHGSHVWVVGRAEPENYDAVVTDRTGVVVAAPGADCMPILFADPVSKVIGAAHAGWKGTLMGVAMATVGAMVRDFGCRATDIVVAVGPSVGACCFTLDRQQALDFLQVHQDCVPDPESTRPHVNLRLANRVLLQRGGVLPEHIHDDSETERSCVTPCTSCHPEDFFSHTRDGLNFGTQVGFLWIRGTDRERRTEGTDQEDGPRTDRERRTEGTDRGGRIEGDGPRGTDQGDGPRTTDRERRTERTNRGGRIEGTDRWRRTENDEPRGTDRGDGPMGTNRWGRTDGDGPRTTDRGGRIEEDGSRGRTEGTDRGGRIKRTDRERRTEGDGSRRTDQEDGPRTTDRGGRTEEDGPRTTDRGDGPRGTDRGGRIENDEPRRTDRGDEPRGRIEGTDRGDGPMETDRERRTENDGPRGDR